MSTADLPEEDSSSTTAPQQRWRWVGGGVTAAVGVFVFWAYGTGRTPESVLWVIGAALLLVPILAFGLIRWKYGLTSREASRGTLTGLTIMAVWMLLFSPIYLLESPLRGQVFWVLAVALAGGGWLDARRRIAAAGPIMLEVADPATRRWAIPGALLGVIAAVNTGVAEDGSVFLRVLGVGVGTIVAVMGLRARSATLAFRERGIASFAGFLGWEKIQDFGWSPGAEATLTLTVSSRFLPSTQRPLRIAPEAREAVLKLLGERVRTHGVARASTAPAAEAVALRLPE